MFDIFPKVVTIYFICAFSKQTDESRYFPRFPTERCLKLRAHRSPWSSVTPVFWPLQSQHALNWGRDSGALSHDDIMGKGTWVLPKRMTGKHWFTHYWPLVTGGFPSRMLSVVVFLYFFVVSLNKWLNKRSSYRCFEIWRMGRHCNVIWKCCLGGAGISVVEMGLCYHRLIS